MNFPFHTVLHGICALGLLLSSCTVYRPDPPHLQADAKAWLQISQTIVPQGKETRLKWEKLSLVGLMLNPDLNKARLKFLNAKHASQYAGLWEDPSLSLNGNRYLTGVTYDRGVALGLSIPVSGRTALARRVAEMYSEADYAELCAQENDYLTRLRTLCYIIQITHIKHDLIRRRLNQAKEEQANITHLHELGEAAIADLHAATQRCSDLLKEQQELESEHLDKHLELIAMLGLHPGVGKLEVADDLPRGVPASVPIATEEALLTHPKLLAAMSAYRTTEAELKLEIRKQYPDLSLSPGYGHEEGNNKLMLDVGFTLPLWNRNREAIARAQGNRALSRRSAIDQYRELLQTVHTLARRQELALQHCRAEYERLLALQQATEQQEQLYRLGEASLPALAGTRHETYTRRLAYLDCLAQLLEIQVALQSHLIHTHS